MYYFNSLDDLISKVLMLHLVDPYLPKFLIWLLLDTRTLSLFSLDLMAHGPNSTSLMSECGTRNRSYASECEDRSGAHPLLLPLPLKDIHTLGLPGLIKENIQHPIILEF